MRFLLSQVTHIDTHSSIPYQIVYIKLVDFEISLLYVIHVLDMQIIFIRLQFTGCLRKL